MRISGHGIEADLPSGWEGTIRRRPDPEPPEPAPLVEDDGAGSTSGSHGEPSDGSERATARTSQAMPVAHFATFALPADRGDFGSGAVEVMTAGDAFAALVEFGPEAAGSALFARKSMPRPLTVDLFDPRALQRSIAGQAGAQVFFTEKGRAFCLFAVLGSHAERTHLVRRVNQVLATVRISPR